MSRPITLPSGAGGRACPLRVDGVSAEQVLKDTLKNAFDGISEDELSTALVLSARQRLEAEPNYGTVAARLLMDKIRHEGLTFLADGAALHTPRRAVSVTRPRALSAVVRGAELKHALKERGLSVEGTRADLLQRLAQVDEERRQLQATLAHRMQAMQGFIYSKPTAVCGIRW